MNLEDLKTLLEWSKKARAILSRRVEPIGNEYDILADVVADVQSLKMIFRDITIPGISKAWSVGIVAGAVAFFRDKVKKDIMPVQYAKDDNLVVEPLYRPKIFGMTDFTVTWSGVTPPAVVDLLAPNGTPGPYNLQVDKELIILTDIIMLSGSTPVTELLVTVDGEVQRPIVMRKDFEATDLKIFTLPLPVVADINLRIQGRVETASGTFKYLPIGIHVVLGSIHAKTLT